MRKWFGNKKRTVPTDFWMHATKHFASRVSGTFWFLNPSKSSSLISVDFLQSSIISPTSAFVYGNENRNVEMETQNKTSNFMPFGIFCYQTTLNECIAHGDNLQYFFFFSNANIFKFFLTVTMTNNTHTMRAMQFREFITNKKLFRRDLFWN